MKRLGFYRTIIIALLASSVLFFIIQQLIFRDIRSTLFYFLQDFLFLPLNILFVTFILNKIIVSREKKDRLEQINIVIGAFFFEAGTGAIELLNPFMPDSGEVGRLLDMDPGWSDKDFEAAALKVKSMTRRARLGERELATLKEGLCGKKDRILQMFANPNLLEHDTFTETLWALYHFIDELQNRDDLAGLPEPDLEHLSNDAARAYGLLVYEWVIYMKYLKRRYPYLWSMAARKNPFAENSVIIT